jgi:hypothetical protein
MLYTNIGPGVTAPENPTAKEVKKITGMVAVGIGPSFLPALLRPGGAFQQVGNCPVERDAVEQDVVGGLGYRHLDA